MDNQGLKNAFDQLTNYIGQVVQVMRVSSGNKRHALALLLIEQFGWHINDRQIRDIEMSRRRLSFAEFEKICQATDFTVEGALKAAVLLRQKESEPKAEVLKETLDELDFQTWKRRQNGD